jgi:octaprenyl-diphosphate synthase
MDVTLRTQFQAQAAQLDHLMRQDLNHIRSPLLKQVIDYALFNGGKRLRPLLNILLAKACQHADGHAHQWHQFALCFEYLHVASLLHDDVIDHAVLRRGKPSANTVWGNQNVILAGDFLHSRALFLAGTYGSHECLALVCAAVQNMVDGEYLQLENTVQQTISEHYYFQVLEDKTAALISAACETACILAQASTEQRQAAQSFGKHIGLAFQIVDDILDYTGDAEKMGKQVGNDWIEQRMTLPLIYALQASSAADQAWLRQQFNSTRAERAKSLATVSQLLQQCGAFQQAQDRASTLVDAAIVALSLFPDSKERDLLQALSYYVLQRAH